MSTTLIDGGPAGPDEVGGTYRNRILTDRAVWWEALGARQGVIRGFDWSTVAGQMELDLTPGLALVEERDSLGAVGTGRGYTVWTDATATASFGVASAADRNDAVVLAFVDVSVGLAAVGTETSIVGAQVVVVPGVSGATTPRTDADISDAVGSGGWMRLADVLIASTDTEINPVNVTPTGAQGGKVDLTPTLNLTPASGVVIDGENFRRIGDTVAFYVSFHFTSQVTVGATGNFANTGVAILQDPLFHPVVDATFSSGAGGPQLAFYINPVDDTFQLVSGIANESLDAGEGLSFGGTYLAEPL